MSINKAVTLSILPVALLATCVNGLASSGNPIVQLPWKPKTEILEYYSCGAADACWVAQVKYKKTGKRIATLRCDGEKLISSVGSQPETITAENCRRFENDNKFKEIPVALRALLNR